MGIRLDDALKGHDEKRLRLTNAVRDSKGKPFLIFEDINQMSIVLHDGICGREALEAYVKAVMMANGVTSFKLEEKLDSFKNSCQAMGKTKFLTSRRVLICIKKTELFFWFRLGVGTSCFDCWRLEG